MPHPDTVAYNQALASPEDTRICDLLAAEIDSQLPEAENRIWHAHPVWFLDGNPIVGYSKLKDGIRLLFWSGQSFFENDQTATAPHLHPEGKFKAAEARYATLGEVNLDHLRLWLQESRHIQWDYKNIVRRKGRLERLK